MSTVPIRCTMPRTISLSNTQVILDSTVDVVENSFKPGVELEMRKSSDRSSGEIKVGEMTDIFLDINPDMTEKYKFD